MTTTRARRSRIAFVAATLVVLLEGGGSGIKNNNNNNSNSNSNSNHGLILGVEAFVLPSNSNPLTHGLLPSLLQHEPQEDSVFPLRSFKFIKGESTYGDLVDGAVVSGMIGGMLGGNGGSTSISGFGGLATKGGSRSMATNSLASTKRRAFPAWWASKSGFSRSTPTTLLAAGSIESWPVLEADDIQILVRKGEAIEEEDDDDDYGDDEGYKYEENDDYGNPVAKKSSSSVKATLERWERDIALEVVGRDGYPMVGNEMQPTPNNYYSSNGGEENNDRCTQKVEFNVANGDIYPFSGTVSVPPPLTVEDSTGNQQSVMMVLNNPEDDDDDDEDAGFGNSMLTGSPSSSSLVRQQGGKRNSNKRSKRRGKTLEAMIEPIYKSPDEKYAEAQRQQQQQYEYEYEYGYDEYGNEIFNRDSEKTTIPSQGYQSFQVDATDPASGKIKISLERDENSGGGGLGGAFRSAMGGGSGNSDISEARVEIYHGFRDLDGNFHSYNPEEDDKRISLDVATMHPSFSSVVDTMPSDLLAKHSLSVPDARNYDPRVSSYQPYLEVRIVNTGGVALKAGVQSYMPFYKPQRQQEKEAQERHRRRQQYQRSGTTSLSLSSAVKADDPFLLVDSAQSSTSSRRMHNTVPNQSQREYVSAKRTRRADNFRAETLQGFGGNSNGFMGSRESGVKADVPGGSATLKSSSESRDNVARTKPKLLALGYSKDSNDSRRQRNTENKNGYDRNGMGTSLSDRVPEAPLGPDRAIDTIAIASGGRVSGTSNKLALASFGGNGGSASGMQSLGRQQQLRDTRYFTSGQQQQSSSAIAGNGNVIGDGVINGRPPLAGKSPFAAYGTMSESSANRYNTIANNRMAGSGSSNKQNFGAFAGNGMVIGDGVIKGQQSSPGGFTGFSSGNYISGKDAVGGSGSFNNNGFSGQANNNFRMQGTTDEFGNYDGNNNDSFGGSTMNSFSSDSSDGPFGGMGRPPQTTANSKNPFATLNGEASENSSNSSPFGGSANNNFSSNSNDFGSNSNGFSSSGNGFSSSGSGNGFGSSSNSFNSNSNGFSSSGSNSNGFSSSSSSGFGSNNNSFNSNGFSSSSSSSSSNDFGSNNNSFQSNSNSFQSNSNSNNSFGGGGMGSPQRPPQPNVAGRTSAMKNPFSGLNNGVNGSGSGLNSPNSSPFGSIGSPSTTAMRSRNINTDFVEDDFVEDEGESSKWENPIMGFAKNLVKGITGS